MTTTNQCMCGAMVEAVNAKQLRHCCQCDSWKNVVIYDEHIQIVHLGK